MRASQHTVPQVVSQVLDLEYLFTIMINKTSSLARVCDKNEADPQRVHTQGVREGGLMRRAMILWAICLTVVATRAVAQTRNIVVRPKEIFSVFVNPGKGIQTFQR